MLSVMIIPHVVGIPVQDRERTRSLKNPKKPLSSTEKALQKKADIHLVLPQLVYLKMVLSNHTFLRTFPIQSQCLFPCVERLEMAPLIGPCED
jgi:hypothetical protein